jgi:hypothetical protein
MGFFPFAIPSRSSPGLTHLPVQGVSKALISAVNRPEGEADHLPPSSAEVKNAWSYTSTPPVRFHDVVVNQA